MRQSRGYPLLSDLRRKDPQVAEFARLVWDNIYRMGDSITTAETTAKSIAAALAAVEVDQASFRKGATVLATASGLTGNFVVVGGLNGQVLTLRSNSPPTASFQTLGSLQLGKSNLGDLQNVVVPAPTLGDVLQFDGTNWVNAARGFIERGRVTHSLLQSIGNAADAILAFDTERFDPGAMHDVAVNNSRVTLAAGQAGDYLLGANVSWAANVTGARRVRIFKNATTLLASTVVAAASATLTTDVAISVVASLADTDYVEVQVYQDSGGPLDAAKSADYSPELWWTRVA